MNKKRVSIPQLNKVRAELQKEIKSICPFCDNSDVGHFQIHHIDENPSNNEKSNLILLCANCHSRITKNDLLQKEVMLKKIELLSNLSKNQNNHKKDKTINFNEKVGNAIVGDGNTINIKNIKKNNKRNYPEGSIGFDNLKSNYIGYLIDRFHDFKKYEMKNRMNYAIFPSQLKKKYKTGSTRTIYHIPVTKFKELASIIQGRIELTKLAKIKGRNHKKYKTYEEYIEHNDEN